MSLRLLQIVLPRDRRADLVALLEADGPRERWEIELNDGVGDGVGGGLCLTTVLLRSDLVEPLSDGLQARFGSVGGFRMVLLPVEATFPRLPASEEAAETEAVEVGGVGGVGGGGVEGEKKWTPRIGRVSREELDEDIRGSARAGALFVVMVALATVVACAGLLKDSPAVIIGAMVIAPLLGPNIALALGTTLGDLSLIRSAVKSNLVGMCVAVGMSAAAGLVVRLDPLTAEMQARTAVDFGDVLVAVASGAAGAIAFTTGAPSTIVGVMVAVALLPPTAAAGMLLGAGAWADAGRATILTLINVVCINLSATAVFLLQGVRPTSWWDKDRARAASLRAIVIWVVVLGALVGLMVLAEAEA